jgi:6-phosphogluconolactonase
VEAAVTAGPRVHIFPTPDAAAEAAAREFLRLAARHVETDGRFNVALSGGSTPTRLYAILAREPYAEEVPWERVHVFWGDERSVAPDHPESNYGAARDALLAHVPLPAANVHRIRGELDPEEAAHGYERELRSHFGLEERSFEAPRFDLVLLGMGSDGHTASLFPDSDALAETRRLAVASWIEKLKAERITLTRPVFDGAALILFLVTGEEKAEIMRAVLEGPPGRYPAQLIHPASGELRWIIDHAASRLLETVISSEQS